ncbi:MAG: quinoprotein glucose dehydrogenase [Bryobacterales bacterium]|jgi:quinoprotein glucose dehydrogenase|nr:quinoprotein glucose dehydrogenase [Bryobacterales bacterium]
MAINGLRWIVPLTVLQAVGTLPVCAQRGAQNGEWHFYGGDAGSTKYSALDQINASNVKDLKIVWEWKAQNFGKRPDFNWEVTPLMAGGVLYFTAGTRRDAVAVDAVTGETLWIYRLDEGPRGTVVARVVNRGLAYWTDGKGDERILVISPGYQLIELNAKTGLPITTFGTSGKVELTEGLDRPAVKPGQIGASSPAIIVKDTVVVGAALLAGTAPTTKENVPGYIRGFDVRTGKKIWTFKTIPRPGEFGNETWENDSWKYSGNTGAWAPLSADEELGYVYIPVEMPTGDFYGGNRPGANLFSDSLVCLDARTGKRVWHYQLVHHDVWDWDIAAPPILVDINKDGKKIKAVAQVTKQAFAFVFDRVTGQPVWPIEERPVPQSDVPGERTSPTQPFPTKPAAFDRQGSSPDVLIDFTPALRQEALKIASQYKMGPLYSPPIVPDTDGKSALFLLPAHVGGVNWPGGAVDAETGVLYVASVTQSEFLSVTKADPKRSDMGYVGGGRGGPARGGAPAGTTGNANGGPARIAPPTFSGNTDDSESFAMRPAARTNVGPQGLPLVKPPWGRITAIDLNSGDHMWTIANGDAPDYIKNHPALKGIDLSNTGKPSRSLLMVTKSLLFGSDGNNLWASPAGAGGNTFRAIDKKTGKVIHEMTLPAMTTGVPMTYMADGRQFIVVAVGAAGFPAELVALALP